MGVFVSEPARHQSPARRRRRVGLGRAAPQSVPAGLARRPRAPQTPPPSPPAPSGSEWRQPYTLSNLDLVTESLTLMAGKSSEPAWGGGRGRGSGSPRARRPPTAAEPRPSLPPPPPSHLLHLVEALDAGRRLLGHAHHARRHARPLGRVLGEPLLDDAEHDLELGVVGRRRVGEGAVGLVRGLRLDALVDEERRVAAVVDEQVGALAVGPGEHLLGAPPGGGEGGWGGVRGLNAPARARAPSSLPFNPLHPTSTRPGSRPSRRRRRPSRGRRRRRRGPGEGGGMRGWAIEKQNDKNVPAAAAAAASAATAPLPDPPPPLPMSPTPRPPQPFLAWVEKMLHEHQRTSAPRAVSDSMRTAVWIVMCREPAMRAPLKGWAVPNSVRHARRPGISASASSISMRPKSAWEMSLTLNWRAKIGVCAGAWEDGAGGARASRALPTTAAAATRRPSPSRARAGTAGARCRRGGAAAGTNRIAASPAAVAACARAQAIVRARSRARARASHGPRRSLHGPRAGGGRRAGAWRAQTFGCLLRRAARARARAGASRARGRRPLPPAIDSSLRRAGRVRARAVGARFPPSRPRRLAHLPAVSGRVDGGRHDGVWGWVGGRFGGRGESGVGAGAAAKPLRALPPPWPGRGAPGMRRQICAAPAAPSGRPPSKRRAARARARAGRGTDRRHAARPGRSGRRRAVPPRRVTVARGRTDGRAPREAACARRRARRPLPTLSKRVGPRGAGAASEPTAGMAAGGRGARRRRRGVGGERDARGSARSHFCDPRSPSVPPPALGRAPRQRHQQRRGPLIGPLSAGRASPISQSAAPPRVASRSPRRPPSRIAREEDPRYVHGRPYEGGGGGGVLRARLGAGGRSAFPFSRPPARCAHQADPPWSHTGPRVCPLSAVRVGGGGFRALGRAAGAHTHERPAEASRPRLPPCGRPPHPPPRQTAIDHEERPSMAAGMTL